jgi:hypothetical protein
MMDRRLFLIGLLLLGVSQGGTPAHADGGGGNSGNGGGNGHDGKDDDGDDDDWDNASSAAERGDIVPLPAILKLALANTPGRVIAVKLNRRGTSYVYRIKILTQTGRKVELLIDARTRVVTKVK